MKVFEPVGGAALDSLSEVGALSIQLWAGVRASRHALPLVGKRERWRAAVREMSAIGTDALPMIAIVAGCAGFILAMQSGAELRRFGALQLVVDILAVGFTRELGPLLTAIVVSSRSGSAISAEIGTMKVTSEIDALRTMALDPIEIVLAPKFIAALIVVPCLAVMSSVFGILAGSVFMFLTVKMPLAMYARSVVNAIVLRDVFIGLLKSAAFSAIVVQVGCNEGFKVQGGADAVGRSTTSAVVKSTFLVIVADLFFTALFYMMGSV